jgi:hypothetical protein
MIEPVIAVVFDFDETLGPDTISFFLQKQGINVDKFWQDVKGLISEEWDPPFAYMHQMLLLAKQKKLDLSKKILASTGLELPLFPGLPEA